MFEIIHTESETQSIFLHLFRFIFVLLNYENHHGTIGIYFDAGNVITLHPNLPLFIVW